MEEIVEKQTIGNRIADRVANSIGSWKFIIIQSIILALWIVLNSLAFAFKWDGYPFVFLNLALSFEAAFSAPFILMSQNRQASKDRLSAERDLESDLKSEKILEHLEVQELVLQKHLDSIMAALERQDQANTTDYVTLMRALLQHNTGHEEDRVLLTDIKQLAEIRRRRSPSHKIDERTTVAASE